MNLAAEAAEMFAAEVKTPVGSWVWAPNKTRDRGQEKDPSVFTLGSDLNFNGLIHHSIGFFFLTFSGIGYDAIWDFPETGGSPNY